MDKCTISSNGHHILEIKTGINHYRGISICLFIFCTYMFILNVVFHRHIAEIAISITMACVSLLISIFTEKIVCIFRLPTYHLIVSNDQIIYKTRKTQFIYKIDETILKFHPFYEGFETVSLLHIHSNEQENYIAITKKQYELIKKFIGKKDT